MPICQNLNTIYFIFYIFTPKFSLQHTAIKLRKRAHHSRTAVPPIFGGTAVRNRKAGIFRTVAQFCSEHKSYSVPNRVFRIFYSNCSEQIFIGFFSEQPFRIHTAICSEQSVPNGSCIFSEQDVRKISSFFLKKRFSEFCTT